MSPYAYDLNDTPGPASEIDVSNEPPCYENAEALIVLERLGYTLDLTTMPRQIPPSLLASVRCVLEVRAYALLKLTRRQNAPVSPSPSGAPTGSSESIATYHGASSASTQLSISTVSTARPAKRKRDEFEGEGDSD